MNNIHITLQTHFKEYYDVLAKPIKAASFALGNEVYGELYYYSVIKLLKQLHITEQDHFLDIGSGLGKLVLQVFLTTPAHSVTGIEINPQRHEIATNVQEQIIKRYPEHTQRHLNMILGDFLYFHAPNVTIAYTCSTVFSYALLEAIGEKLNTIETLHTVVSLRKLPDLLNFRLSKKLFLQGTWDNTVCYIYRRVR